MARKPSSTKPYNPNITREQRSKEKLNRLSSSLAAWKTKNKVWNSSFDCKQRILENNTVEDSVDFMFYNVWGKNTAHLRMPRDNDSANDFLAFIKDVVFVPGLIAIQRTVESFADILIIDEKQDAKAYSEITSKISQLNNVRAIEVISNFEKVDSERFKALINTIFRFTHKGKSAYCFWGRASDASLGIARCVDTSDENCLEEISDLIDLTMYGISKGFDKNSDFELLSFYVVFEEDVTAIHEIIDYCEAINIETSRRFLIAPKIIILNVGSDLEGPLDLRLNTQESYDFSSKCRSEILKGYWHGMVDSNSPALRFLNAFRIIEYASIEKKVQLSGKLYLEMINSVGSAKNEFHIQDLRTFTSFSKSLSSRADSDLRLEVFKEYVDKHSLYTFLDANKVIFSKTTRFDGQNAFVVPPLYCDDYKEWCEGSGGTSFNGVALYIDKIRHALAHGGEARESDQVITFSKANMKKLYPYSSLARFVADFIVFERD